MSVFLRILPPALSHCRLDLDIASVEERYVVVPGVSFQWSVTF